jgi:hypothetical protein
MLKSRGRKMEKKKSSVGLVPPTVGKKPVKTIELPKKESDARQEMKLQNQKLTRPDTTKTGEPKLVIKNGATDCRRSEKALSKVIDERMKMDSHNGDVYAFANTSQTIVKLVQFDKTGANLYKKHTNSPIDWPPDDGKLSVLDGPQAKWFLEDVGLPKAILKKHK